MIRPGAVLRAIGRDRRGAAMIEFAILAPVFLAMLVGVLLMGLQLQSYNALRSIAFDVNRHTMIEYQKSNEMTEAQVRQVALAIARSSPYGLSSETFNVVVDEKATGVSGAKNIELTLTYTPPVLVGMLNLHMPRITEVQSIIVPGEPAGDGQADRYIRHRTVYDRLPQMREFPHIRLKFLSKLTMPVWQGVTRGA